MLSPAQRHSARIKAEKQLSECQVLDAGHSLHVKLRALEHDVGRVRSLDVTSDRVAMKRSELLPRWLPTAQAYLDSARYIKTRFWCTALSGCLMWMSLIRLWTGLISPSSRGRKCRAISAVSYRHLSLIP